MAFFVFLACVRGCVVGMPRLSGFGFPIPYLLRTEYNIGYGIYAEAHVDLSEFEIRISVSRFFLQSTFDLQWTSKVIGNHELQHRQTRCAPYTMLNPKGMPSLICPNAECQYANELHI